LLQAALDLRGPKMLSNSAEDASIAAAQVKSQVAQQMPAEASSAATQDAEHMKASEASCEGDAAALTQTVAAAPCATVRSETASSGQVNTQQQSISAACVPQSPATKPKRHHSAVEAEAAAESLAELHLGESTTASVADKGDHGSAAAGSSSSQVCKKQRISACDDAVAALVAGLSLEGPMTPASTAEQQHPAELAAAETRPPLARKRLHSAVDDNATAALLACLNLSETTPASALAASQPDESSTAAAAAAVSLPVAGKKLRTAADPDAVAALVASMSLSERTADARTLFTRVMTDNTATCRAAIAHMHSEEKGRLSGTSKAARKLLGVPFKWSSLRLSTAAVPKHTRAPLPFTQLCLQALSQFR
jgi:hypothetical protein